MTETIKETTHAIDSIERGVNLAYDKGFVLVFAVVGLAIIVIVSLSWFNDYLKDRAKMRDKKDLKYTNWLEQDNEIKRDLKDISERFAKISEGQVIETRYYNEDLKNHREKILIKFENLDDQFDKINNKIDHIQECTQELATEKALEDVKRDIEEIKKDQLKK